MWIKLLLLFFVFSFLFRTDHSFDQDLGRHIKLGEIIWQTGEIPKTNLFSYTNPDSAFINTHWFFEVLVYGISQTIGLQWMLFFKVIIILLSVWLVIKTIPKENHVLLLPIGFIFLHVLRERLELRPEIFSFLFTAVTLLILERFLRKGTKWVYILPIIQLIWISTHIYFFVGLMLQAIFLIQRVGTKLRHLEGDLRWHLSFIVLTASILVSLINPNGLAGVLYPLNVVTNYGYTIVENQTMFLLENIHFRDPNFLFVKLSAGLVGLSLIVAFFRKQVQLKSVLLSTSGVILALMNVRSFPYLVFLSLPAVLQNFGAIKAGRITYALSAFFAILLLFESYFYLNGDYYKYRNDQHEVGLRFTESLKGGMDFVLANELPNPIYNNFDIGSYILYRGYLKYEQSSNPSGYKVFVDGRPEAYPASFFTDVYIPTQSDYTKFKELEEKWGFKTIIFSHTDQTPWGKSFLQNVVKDPSWKLVYIDEFIVVLVAQDVAAGKALTIIDLSKLSSDSYKYTNHLSYLRMGLFFMSTGYGDSGRQFIIKAQQILPQTGVNKFFW